MEVKTRQTSLLTTVLTLHTNVTSSTTITKPVQHVVQVVQNSFHQAMQDPEPHHGPPQNGMSTVTLWKGTLQPQQTTGKP